MNKTLTEIAKEQGAEITDWGDGRQHEIAFYGGEAQLQSTINAWNGQNSGAIGEIACDARTGHTVNIFTGDKPYPNIGTKIYTAPQTLPPEWAEYVQRLESALSISNNFVKSVSINHPDHEHNGEPDNIYELRLKAMWATREVLASKPKG